MYDVCMYVCGVEHGETGGISLGLYSIASLVVRLYIILRILFVFPHLTPYVTIQPIHSRLFTNTLASPTTTHRTDSQHDQSRRRD